MGALLICRSCNNAVASDAITCTKCGSVFQVRGLNIVGVVGGLLLFGSLPTCMLVPPAAIGMGVVGALLLLVGRGYSAKLFTLRTFSADDYKRLGIEPGEGARFTPTQFRAIAMLVLGVIIYAAWTQASTSLRDALPTSPSSPPHHVPPTSSPTQVAPAPAPAPEKKGPPITRSLIKSLGQNPSHYAGKNLKLIGYVAGSHICDMRYDDENASYVDFEDPNDKLGDTYGLATVRVHVTDDGKVEVTSVTR